MFGRKPRIPIDILYAKPDEMQVQCSEMSVGAELENPVEMEKDLVIDNVEVLGVHDNSLDLPIHIAEYVGNLRNTLSESYALLEKNRLIKMHRAQLNHDRKIKKFEYDVGD